MALYRIDDRTPQVAASAYISNEATLIGAVVVGERATVGHQAMLHGCSIGDGSLIGIQAVVMNGAVIGRSCLVGAGAIVTERKSFPDRSLIIGAPARLARPLSDEEVAGLERAAAGYVERGANFRSRLERID